MIRALVSKIPGFYFSDYFQEESLLTALVSIPQFGDILDDLFTGHPDFKATYEALNETAKWVDGIPKNTLLVRLNPDIT